MNTETIPAVNTKDQIKVPSLIDLSDDPEMAFKNDQLNLLLNQPPPVKWLRNHPTATKKDDITGQYVPCVYIPIEKVEFLLTKIFQTWEVEVLREGVMFQSVYVTVRLKVRNPLTGAWITHDGVGAVAVQTDKGKPASALEFVKSNAIMIGLPAAKSYATKDAAENLGKLFGKDLNRKDTLPFAGAYSDHDKIKDAAEAIKQAMQPK